MLNIIVNADDCGFSEKVNNHIRVAIESKRVTSTTVMANMDDLSGAVNLYNDLRQEVSFGIHLNLTEGKPLTYSQVLLDRGFFVEKDSNVILNGKGFRNSYFNKNERKAILNELNAQFEAISDSGIMISHIDSHHFMHTSPGLLLVVAEFITQHKIKKVRQVRNLTHSFLSLLPRKLWGKALILFAGPVSMVDTFCFFSEYLKDNKRPLNGAIELMCHPGSNIDNYIKEEDILLKTDLTKLFNATLINYHQL